MTGQPRVWSPPSARAARSRVRAHRVASRSFTQRLVEIYERALYVVGGLVFQAVGAGLEPTRLGPSSPDDPAVVLTQWLVVVGAVMALAVSLKIMLGFGPLLVGPATQTWLLSTPVDRRMLLHTTFTLVVLLGGATGSGIAVLFVILAGLPIETLALWLGAGALLGVCLASTAVVLQKKPVWSRTAHRSLNVSVGLLAVWAVGLSVARSVVPPLGWNSGGHSWLAIVVGCLTVVAGVAAILAFRESGNLTRASLSSGTEIATATSVSVTFLDMSILGSIVLVRRTRAIGRVRSVRIRGSRVMALVMADCVRVLRMRTGPVMWLFLLPVP